MDAPKSHHDASARQVLQPLVACCIALIVLQSLFVALRLTSRLLVKRAEIGWDDYLIIPGYFINIGSGIVGLIIVHYETIGNPSGYAVIPATPAEVKTKLEPVLKCILAIEQLTLAGNTFPKLSILCLYLRIFPGRSTRIVTYITMCMVFVVWLGWFILGLNECTPVRKQWDRLIPKGHCYNSNHIYRSFAGPNTDPDLLILLIPLPTIWKLEASKWKKLGISILFLMASLGFVVSVVKWVVYFDHDASVIIPAVTTPLVTWLELEPAAYLIAACLPAMRPLFIHLLPQFWLSSIRRSSTNRRPSAKRADYSNGASPGRPWDSAASEVGTQKVPTSRLEGLKNWGKGPRRGYGELNDYDFGTATAKTGATSVEARGETKKGAEGYQWEVARPGVAHTASE